MVHTPADIKNISITVNVTDKNLNRLDKFIASQVSELSRTRIQTLIRTNCVKINGKEINDISCVIKPEDLIEIVVAPLPLPVVTPKEIPLDVVYEDEYLAVINKPAGLTVHPGNGNYSDTLVNALLARYSQTLSTVGGPSRLGIVHRLDKNTSGLLIIAKTDQAHVALSKLLETREIKRTYNAYVWGCLEKIHGTIETNIARSYKDRTKMAVVAIGGKHAVTHYKTLQVFSKRAISLVECQLETGRTHQIRVHLSHLGHPIIGDPEYSTNRIKERKWLSAEAASYILSLNRQMLHAKKLSFVHPMTEQLIALEIDEPEEMKELREILLR